MFWESTRFAQDVPGVGVFERSSTLGPRLGAQGVGGIDVQVSPRLTTFGVFRLEVRSFTDPGGGAVIRIEGGVRMRVG